MPATAVVLLFSNYVAAFTSSAAGTATAMRSPPLVQGTHEFFTKPWPSCTASPSPGRFSRPCPPPEAELWSKARTPSMLPEIRSYATIRPDASLGKTSIVKVQGFKESMVSGCRIQQGVVGVGDLFIGWLHTRRLRLGLSRLCAAPRRGVDSGGTERPMCLHRFRCVARYRRAVPKPLTPIWCHSFSPSFRPHISRYFDIVCKHF